MSLQNELANTPLFVALWKSGVRVRDIARHFGCSTYTAKNAGRQLRILHPNANHLSDLAVAPSSSEEQISQESLNLAPSVATRAQQIKLECYQAMCEGRPSPFKRAGQRR